MIAIFIFQTWTTPDREIVTTLNKQDKTLAEIKELLTTVQDPGYRELVAKVIHSFEPKAEIKIGTWIEGPDGARNIDIEVRSIIEGVRKLLAIEVVDLPKGKTAGVEIIDAFDSKKTDIRADIALVCSNTGFDSTAIRKAKRTRIGLISILHQGDPRIKAVIEEEIYLRKIHLDSMTFTYAGDPLLPKLTIGAHDVRYDGKSVDAWLQLQAGMFSMLHPQVSERIRLTFNLKKATDFQVKNQRVNLGSLAIAFLPRTKWLAQTVRFDASTGIYDYLRGRVRLGGGTNSYVLNGVNFDSATPLAAPPNRNAFGVGLLPGEIDITLAMIEGLDLPDGTEIPKLEPLINPEDLKDIRRPFPPPDKNTQSLPQPSAK